MPIGVCYGRSSKTGFATAMMRDLDVLAPRPPLPKRALPDSVRSKLGFSSSEVAPPSKAATRSPKAKATGAARASAAVAKPRVRVR